MEANVQGALSGNQYSCGARPVNDCPQLPGTILRINIPAGAVINLLGLIEVASPGGICLIVRLPILGGGANTSIDSIVNAIRVAGGTVEFANV